MAAITIQKISGGTVALSAGKAVWTGLIPAAAVAAAAGGDSIVNDGRTYYEVINGGAGSIDVTIGQAKKSSYGEDHDPVVTLAAGVTRVFGPFSKDRFDDGGGLVQFTYSGVTTVTVRAFSLAEQFSSN